MRTHFDNAISAMIADSWAMLSDGDVNSPAGYFAIVEIDGSEKFQNYSTDDDDLDNAIYTAEIGFYFFRENSDGNIFIEHFSSKDNAISRFAQYSESYMHWLDSDVMSLDDDGPCCYGYVTSGGKFHEVGCY